MSRRVLCALAVGASAMGLAGLALGQTPYPNPVPGVRPSWMPDIPLSAAAQANGVVRTYSDGHEWVTVNLGGNPAFPGSGVPGPSGQLGDPRFVGRGSVAQPFRISRYETTAQNWAEFYTAARYAQVTSNQAIPFLTQSDYMPIGVVPGSSGTAVAYPGGEMWPGAGVDWRVAALYCNWLHNDRANTREAFLSGAYDVSTFGYANGQQILDQPQRSPGARYFIPNLDEMMAAMYYDPNRQAPAGTSDSRGGWWNYNITRDTAPAYGPPPVAGAWGAAGNGEANAGWDFGTLGALSVPLGSYATVQSPWGLLDTAGGTSEWTEEVIGQGSRRALLGSAAAWPSGLDSLTDGIGGWLPSGASWFNGFRIAAVVPSPSTALVAGLFLAGVSRRRR